MIITETPAALSVAGLTLNECIRENQSHPLLLLVSGGSALTLLDCVSPSSLTTATTITVLDERFTNEVAHSNFLSLTATQFFAQAQAQGVHFLPTVPAPDESRDQVRDRFENSLRHWKDSHPQGVVIATIGVGADGHTAGIFPNLPTTHPSRWVEAYTLPPGVNPHSERITTTPRFLTEIVDVAIGYCDRTQKAHLVPALYSAEAAAGLPLRVLHDMKDVRFFIDPGPE